MTPPAAAIERFIKATRSSQYTRIRPEFYEGMTARLCALSTHFELPTRFKFVYSASRRVELVTLSDATWIIYDQYLGQTLNLLNRLFIEAQSLEPAIIYFHKVLAERLVEVGRLEQALHCASFYSSHRDVLEAERIDEPWRGLLTGVHEAFLLCHEFGHRIYDKEGSMPEVREQVAELIAKQIRSKQRPFDEIVHDLRNAPAAAIHHTDVEELIKTLLEQKSKTDRYTAAQVKSLQDPQTFEEVFCDIFAADLVLATMTQNGADPVKVLRAIYIGFYHLQALEYLRRFPALAQGEAEWANDIMPHIQSRAHCLHAHLVFIYQAHLLGAGNALDTLTDAVAALEAALLDDQKRHYETVFDAAINLCDNLRRGDWISELGKVAVKKLEDGEALPTEEVQKRKVLHDVVLIMTGWLANPAGPRT